MSIGTTQPDLPPVPEEEDRGSRAMDNELRTISAILRELAKLGSESAKARVVGYISDRFTHRDEA